MNACPKNAIRLIPGNNGFVYPIIDSAGCTGCKTCIRTCPTLDAQTHPSPRQTPLGIHAAWNKDESIRLASSSGGMFSALAVSVLEKGGVVYGATMQEDLNVRHIRVADLDGLSRLRGSKYLQSHIG